MENYAEKIEKLTETKPWITNEELKDVTDKIEDTEKWFDALFENPNQYSDQKKIR